MDLYEENGTNKPALIIQDGGTPPAGYTLKNDLESWDKYASKIIQKNQTDLKDWKCIQREIETIADGICSGDYDANWNNFTSAEKKICCNWILTNVTGANFAACYPDPIERSEVSKTYDLSNTGARRDRVEEMRMKLFGKIALADALEVLNDTTKEGLLELYIGGIRSLASSGQTGLEDFLLSTSIYDGNGTMDGLTLRAYSVIDGSGDTLTDVANQLVSITKDGIY